MNAQEFINTLYSYIWKFILSQEEIDNQINFTPEDGYDGDPAEIWAYDLVELIDNLNTLRYVYFRIVGSIELEIRDSIIKLMTWADKNKELDTHEIMCRSYTDEDINTDTLYKVINIVKQTKLNQEVSEIYQEDILTKILEVINNFKSASSYLTDRRKGKHPIKLDDEYDMQDILHCILTPFFPTMGSEEVIAGNAERRFLKIDFMINDERIGIECKFIRDKTHANGITKELNDDIQTYHKHQNCDTLIFFIFDKNMDISKPKRLEKEYSKMQSFEGKNMMIHLLIRPNN